MAPKTLFRKYLENLETRGRNMNRQRKLFEMNEWVIFMRYDIEKKTPGKMLSKKYLHFLEKNK